MFRELNRVFDIEIAANLAKSEFLLILGVIYISIMYNVVVYSIKKIKNFRNICDNLNRLPREQCYRKLEWTT